MASRFTIDECARTSEYCGMVNATSRVISLFYIPRAGKKNRVVSILYTPAPSSCDKILGVTASNHPIGDPHLEFGLIEGGGLKIGCPCPAKFPNSVGWDALLF